MDHTFIIEIKEKLWLSDTGMISTIKFQISDPSPLIRPEVDAQVRYLAQTWNKPDYHFDLKWEGLINDW